MSNPPIHEGRKFFCPCNTVISYMNVRGPYKSEADQFFVFSDYSPLQPQNFRSTLRLLLGRLNLNLTLHDVHSFRIG